MTHLYSKASILIIKHPPRTVAPNASTAPVPGGLWGVSARQLVGLKNGPSWAPAHIVGRHPPRTVVPNASTAPVPGGLWGVSAWQFVGLKSSPKLSTCCCCCCCCCWLRRSVNAQKMHIRPTSPDVACVERTTHSKCFEGPKYCVYHATCYSMLSA